MLMKKQNKQPSLVNVQVDGKIIYLYLTKVKIMVEVGLFINQVPPPPVPCGE